MGNLGGKKSKVSRPGGVGRGRGVRGGGTADKLGRTVEEQKHGEAGKKVARAENNTIKGPKWEALKKLNVGSLKPGHQGANKSRRKG